MLELIDIWKSYEGAPLLKGVSFSVAKGETVCLLGASGSGKSTLLRLIAGLEFPERGRVCWEGQDLVEVPAHRRGFGLVFQDYALFPHLTVGENVAFGLRMQDLSSPDIAMRVAETLTKVGLVGFESRHVTDLSGGEQQRVALARALAPGPRLLMFDEPLGALDHSLRTRLMDELRHILHGSGIPAVYVTHDQEEAFVLADRVLLLHEGLIVRQGTPADVWTDPGSEWAARFLDSANVLTGRVLPDGRLETKIGIFDLNCDHTHRAGDSVTLLVGRSGARLDPDGNIQGVVTDAIFQQEGFKVTLEDGTYFNLPQAPHLGERICLQVPAARVKCLG